MASGIFSLLVAKALGALIRLESQDQDADTPPMQATGLIGLAAGVWGKGGSEAHQASSVSRMC